MQKKHLFLACTQTVLFLFLLAVVPTSQELHVYLAMSKWPGQKTRQVRNCWELLPLGSKGKPQENKAFKPKVFGGGRERLGAGKMLCASSHNTSTLGGIERPWLFTCGVCPFCTDHVCKGLRQRARAQSTMSRDINIMKKRKEGIPQRRGCRDGAPSLHFICAELWFSLEVTCVGRWPCSQQNPKVSTTVRMENRVIHLALVC